MDTYSAKGKAFLIRFGIIALSAIPFCLGCIIGLLYRIVLLIWIACAFCIGASIVGFETAAGRTKGER